MGNVAMWLIGWIVASVCLAGLFHWCVQSMKKRSARPTALRGTYAPNFKTEGGAAISAEITWRPTVEPPVACLWCKDAHASGKCNAWNSRLWSLAGGVDDPVLRQPSVKPHSTDASSPRTRLNELNLRVAALTAENARMADSANTIAEAALRRLDDAARIEAECARQSDQIATEHTFLREQAEQLAQLRREVTAERVDLRQRRDLQARTASPSDWFAILTEK